MSPSRKNVLNKLHKLANVLNCDCKIIHSPNAFESDDFVDDDYEEEEEEEEGFPDIRSLFEGSGIRMMFKDRPFSACVTDEGNVVGALVFNQDSYWDWGEEPIPVYYFSRVVSPDCQGKGIAKKLLKDFMSNNPRCIIKSETHNRILDQSLVSAGFIEEWEESSRGYSVKLHTFVPESMREDYFAESNGDQKERKMARLKLLNYISKTS